MKIILSLSIVCCLLAVGCRSEVESQEDVQVSQASPSFVGEWYGEVRQHFDPPLNITVNLDKDGGFRLIAVLAESIDTELLSFNGSWTKGTKEGSRGKIILTASVDGEIIELQGLMLDGKLKLTIVESEETDDVFDFTLFSRVEKQQAEQVEASDS